MKKKEKEQSQHFLNENAITSWEEDIFIFEPYAKKIQNLIQNNSSNSNTLTIGIYGKWGEGKTSFMNLIREGIDIKKDNKKGILIYDFNPWRYSTEEEMLFDFFNGLAKTMMIAGDDNIKKAGKRIVKLSNYLKAVKISATVGVPGIIGGKIQLSPDKIVKQIGKEFQGEKMTIEKLSKEVNDFLLDADYKVAVFVDDLDRLDKDEIYTMLKLIKLNAHFKNFIYLLTLDQEHAAKAISKRYGEDIKDGYQFLEKVINVPIQLPRIDNKDFSNYFKSKLESVFKNLDLQGSYKKREEIEKIYIEFRKDYFRSPREILRVMNVFFIDAYSIGDEVNLRDLFWLSALKIRDEQFFNVLKDYVLKPFLGLDSIIDFNDDIIKEKPNGSRKNFEDRFKSSFYYFELLFPDEGNNNFNKPKKTEIISNLCINIDLHYKKYFSYNLSGSTSNRFIYSLEQCSENKDKAGLEQNLKELFENDCDGESCYLLQNLIKTVEKGKFLLYEVVLKNLNDIPKNDDINFYKRNSSIHFIELIASNLSADNNLNNEKIEEFIQYLDILHLAYFTYTFNDSSQSRVFLESKIKILLEENDKEPFFTKYPSISTSIIFKVFKNKNTYMDCYLDKTLSNQNRVIQLIRSFVPIFNGNFHTIQKDDYYYMKSIIDVNLIFEKIKEFNEDKINNVQSNGFDISDRIVTSEENLEQFIYWHTSDLKDREDSQGSNDLA